VNEQQKAEYGQHGRKRCHYFDFVQRQRSRTVAYAVKYEEDVGIELEETLRLVAQHLGDGFADEFCILTEKNLTLTQIENAKEILACASDFDFEGHAIVKAALARLPSRISLDEVTRAAGLGDRGRRAAVALMQKGSLRIPPNVRLGGDAVLVNHANKNSGR
jgi:hypothetical protein